MVGFKQLKSAKGMSGTLLRVGEDYFFRAKANNEDGFIDFLIRHNDLEIIINDDDTQFYELKDGEMALDHSKETLGIY